MVDILPLGSGSVDPHIFADSDPGSQNLADPTDPDPKHWYLYIIQLIGFDNTNLKLQDHHCCLNNKQFQILRLDANKRIVNSKKTNFKIVKLKNIEQNGWKTIMKYKIFK